MSEKKGTKYECEKSLHLVIKKLLAKEKRKVHVINSSKLPANSSGYDY